MGMSFQKKEKNIILEEDHARKGSSTLLDCPRTNDNLPIAETPNDNSIETVQAVIDDIHKLPAGLYDDIKSTIDHYCRQNNIQDEKKIHPHEWKAICMNIGEFMKSRHILQDKTRLREGGIRYDGEKVSALLDLYDYACGQYKQIPFMHNFARFAGVSLEYVNDYMQKGLTSTQVGLREKLHNIQRAGLVDAVSAGGSATVGNIFLSKALGGLQETSTVVHVSSAPAQIMESVPDLARLGDGSGN